MSTIIHQSNRQTITLPRCNNLLPVAVCILRDTFAGTLNEYDPSSQPRRVDLCLIRENGSVEGKNATVEGIKTSLTASETPTHIEGAPMCPRVRGRRVGLRPFQAPRTDWGKAGNVGSFGAVWDTTRDNLRGAKDFVTNSRLASGKANPVRLLTTGGFPCVGTLSQLSVIE